MPAQYTAEVKSRNTCAKTKMKIYDNIDDTDVVSNNSAFMSNLS